MSLSVLFLALLGSTRIFLDHLQPRKISFDSSTQGNPTSEGNQKS